MKCNSKPKKIKSKKRSQSRPFFVCQKEFVDWAKNLFKHFSNQYTSYIFQTHFCMGAFSFVYLFFAKIFSGVLILHTPIMKSINDHTAVTQIPIIVQVIKNIAMPEPILPA